MVFKVGKGNKIRFWIDPWCGNNVLSQVFPDLFSMAAQRNVTVEDYWDQNLGHGGWNLRLLRDFNDWELGLVDNMLVELRNYRVTLEEDSVLWRGGADGLFKVKEAYRVLANAEGADFPHSNVWVDKVPTKIAFFCLGSYLGEGFLSICLKLGGCLVQFSMGLHLFFVDEIECASHGIYTQQQALEFLERKVKKLPFYNPSLEKVFPRVYLLNFEEGRGMAILRDTFIANVPVRQNNFRPKCLYVAVMLRRMMDAILNKDAMDDKGLGLREKAPYEEEKEAILGLGLSGLRKVHFMGSRYLNCPLMDASWALAERLGSRQRASDCDCPMKMKILSWNVRGANDSSKRKVIKTFIRNQRVDVICIQETKIQAMSDYIARSIGSGRFIEWKAVNAEGASGGILVCWDNWSLEVLDWEEGQFTLSCRFRNVENGVSWIFTGVYGPFSKMEREALWDELGAIRGLWEDPWCIGGDFNITLFLRERSSQRRMNSAMRKFAEIVDDLGLMDLPLSRGRMLPRPVSDHFPIMLVGGIRRGPTPFRFENMWLKVEGFKDLVRSWWQGIEVRGSGSYKLATKMKEVKQKLKIWNREVFGKLETNKSVALQQVEFWDREESGRILTVEETELKKEAKENYRKWVTMEETHWRQLSREIWLKEGDRNTGFFHRMASAHRRNNQLERIKINGEWLLEEQEIREGIASTFQSLLSEDMG
uniref:Endonuclease/exonuclease/phosphatase domain-containing protein n=1 Tax=Vitis vinifera TaxID=29760 RepID=A5BM50_VITVI|nr:hypothetical protein VITISV_022513 [Vitis vinifera]